MLLGIDLEVNMDAMDYAAKFMMVKDATKASGTVRDTDRLVASRIPELSQIASASASRQKVVSGG